MVLTFLHHLAETRGAEPLGVTASLLYQDFQDDHKVKAVPWGAAGHGTEDEIYRVFPTAPLAPGQEKTPVFQWQCMRWNANSRHSASNGEKI